MIEEKKYGIDVVIKNENVLNEVCDYFSLLDNVIYSLKFGSFCNGHNGYDLRYYTSSCIEYINEFIEDNSNMLAVNKDMTENAIRYCEEIIESCKRFVFEYDEWHDSCHLDLKYGRIFYSCFNPVHVSYEMEKIIKEFKKILNSNEKE